MLQTESAYRKNRSDGVVADISDVLSGGKSKIKRKIRDIQRTLSRDNLPSNIRVDNERALKALQVELEEKELQEKARVLAKKYHMVRFFEKKKAVRKYKQALNTVKTLETSETAEKKDLKKAKKVLKHCEVDLAYVVNFPKTEKYVSLYPVQDEDNKVDSNAKKGILETDKRRLYWKKEVEKMLDDGSLPISIREILKGGPRDSSYSAKGNFTKSKKSAEGDPSIAKKKDVQEEDDFFE